MNVEIGISWMEKFNEKIQSEKEYLTQLDSPIGDSDHGNNMSRGMGHVMEAIKTTPPESFEALLKLITTNLLSKVGGASGPLYGSAFMGMLKAYQTGDASWADLFQSGLDSIQKRGKAEVGDKTMIDVWKPVINALNNQTFSHAVIDEAIEATKDLKAKKGRASYVGDRSIGHIDPGAYSSGLLFHALLEAGVEL